jgi:hypothetical protein
VTFEEFVGLYVLEEDKEYCDEDVSILVEVIPLYLNCLS